MVNSDKSISVIFPRATLDNETLSFGTEKRNARYICESMNLKLDSFESTPILFESRVINMNRLPTMIAENATAVIKAVRCSR